MTHNEQHVAGYHAGDALELVVTVEDEQGNAIDISTVNEITWLLKDEKRDPDNKAILQKTLTGGGITYDSDGTNGIFVVQIDTGDTTAEAGNKHHRARLTDSGGNRSTLFTGDFTIDE